MNWNIVIDPNIFKKFLPSRGKTSPEHGSDGGLFVEKIVHFGHGG